MFTSTTPSDVRSAMQALRDLGVATVKVDFSGGNDEGGADGIDFLDAAGVKIPGVASSSAYSTRTWDPVTKNYGPDHWVVSSYVDDATKPQSTRYVETPATDEQIRLAKIQQVLEAPIYDRFGSFAGEFEVYGQVIWDVNAGTHTLTGQESSTTWEELD